jgi:hypothetical protein
VVGGLGRDKGGEELVTKGRGIERVSETVGLAPLRFSLTSPRPLITLGSLKTLSKVFLINKKFGSAPPVR